MINEAIQHYNDTHVWTEVGYVGAAVLAFALIGVVLLSKRMEKTKWGTFCIVMIIPSAVLPCLLYIFASSWDEHALKEAGLAVAATVPQGTTGVSDTADLGSCLLDHEKDIHASPSVPTSCTGQQHRGDSMTTVVLTVGDGGVTWVRKV